METSILSRWLLGQANKCGVLFDEYCTIRKKETNMFLL